MLMWKQWTKIKDFVKIEYKMLILFGFIPIFIIRKEKLK